METDAPREFAHARAALVVAPAGCGKTELLARAVQHLQDQQQLILTHTHAGVRAVRSRLHRLGVPSRSYRVDTIAGFSLRLAVNYPRLSGLDLTTPERQQWNLVYPAALQALKNRHVAGAIAARYGGVMVDEYQDCTLPQHAIVLRLAELLRTRVVGDPLQGIFSFGDNQTVDFGRDIPPCFERLPDLTTPWRWKQSNPDLGDWLLLIRSDIERCITPEFDTAPVTVHPAGRSEQIRACKSASSLEGTVVGIRKWPGDAHDVAMSLGGSFTSMEEVECHVLLSGARQLDSTTGFDRALAAINFAAICATAVDQRLSAARAAFRSKLTATSQSNQDQGVVALLNKIATTGSLGPVPAALRAIVGLPGVALYRREAFDDMQAALRLHAESDGLSLRDAAWQVRDRTRHTGRRVDNKTISRTLLVKGLEFDHAIVLDVNEFTAGPLDFRNLYVALTRGSQTLTVLI